MWVKSTRHTRVRMRVLTALSYAASTTYARVKQLESASYVKVNGMNKNEKVMLLTMPVKDIKVDVVPGELGVYYKDEKLFYVNYKKWPYNHEIKKGVKYSRAAKTGTVNEINYTPTILKGNTPINWDYSGKDFVMFAVSDSGEMWIYWSDKEPTVVIQHIPEEKKPKEEQKKTKPEGGSYRDKVANNQYQQSSQYEKDIDLLLVRIRGFYKSRNLQEILTNEYFRKNFLQKAGFDFESNEKVHEDRQIFDDMVNYLKQLNKMFNYPKKWEALPRDMQKEFDGWVILMKRTLLDWCAIGWADAFRWMCRYLSKKHFDTYFKEAGEIQFRTVIRSNIFTEDMTEINEENHEKLLKMVLKKYMELFSDYLRLVEEEKVYVWFGYKMIFLMKEMVYISGRLFANDRYEAEVKFLNETPFNMGTIKYYFSVFKGIEHKTKALFNYNNRDKMYKESHEDGRGTQGGAKHTREKDSESSGERDEKDGVNVQKTKDTQDQQVLFYDDVNQQANNWRKIFIIDRLKEFNEEKGAMKDQKMSNDAQKEWTSYKDIIEKVLSVFSLSRDGWSAESKERLDKTTKEMKEKILKKLQWSEEEKESLRGKITTVLYLYEGDLRAKLHAIKEYHQQNIDDELENLKRVYHDDVEAWVNTEKMNNFKMLNDTAKQRTNTDIKKQFKNYLAKVDNDITKFKNYDEYTAEDPKDPNVQWGQKIKKLDASLKSWEAGFKNAIEHIIEESLKKANTGKSFQIPSYGPVYSAIWGTPMIHF